MSSRTHFRNLWAAGYRRLVPIIPPDAAISPQSSLAKRPGAVGKSPGIRGFDNLWRGFDWLKHETTESNLEEWAAMGAGVGIRTGDGLVGVDVDTKNGDLCVRIAEVIQKRLGVGAVRVGDAPKFLALFNLSEPAPYQRVEFDDGAGATDKNGRPAFARVEALTEGRQFVAYGIHPRTLKPYSWANGVPARSTLPTVTRAQLAAFFAELSEILPAARRPVTEAEDRDAPPQETLRGDPDLVRRAVSALPNSVDLFPVYDDYVRVGAAIKASLPDDPDEALQLFLQWAGRWEGGDFNADVAIADFGRIKAPFKIGARWLYDHADSYSGGQFSSAQAFFAPIADGDLLASDDIFAAADRLEKQRAVAEAAIHWIDPLEWEGREPPPREWVVEGLVPASEVTLLTGAGGVGKTLLAQQIATAVTQGLPIFGRETRKGRALLFLCEDDEHELNRRQRDINASLCLSFADIAGRMHIASRKHQDNLLVLFERGGSKMSRTPLWHQLMKAVESFQPDIVVIDTIADVFGGSEIDRQQVRQFVQGGLGAYAAATGCAVLALGHPSRAGESTGEGTSGSTAWHASVRSRLYLTHASEDGSGDDRLLSTKKSNYGPSGGKWQLRWSKGAFDCIASSSVTAAAPTFKNLLDGYVLDTLRLLQRECIRATANTRSPYSAVKAMREREPDLFTAYGDVEIATALRTLQAAGALVEVDEPYKGCRGPGLVVVEQLAPPDDDLFA